MKKWKQGLVLGLLGFSMCLTSAINGEASPANPAIQRYTQPSGQPFEAQLVGDEYLNYTIASKTGDLVDLGKDGYWYYSILDKSTKKTKASSSKYLIDTRPKEALTVKDVKQLKKDMSSDDQSKSFLTRTNWNQNQHLLVVLVEFNDAQLTYSEEDWEKRVFSQTEKSLVTYYKEATKDKINILPAKKKSGQQDGIIRIKLDQNHPNAGSNFDELRPALKKALESIHDLVDIAEYDTNKDGIIEQNELHIMNIFAGYENSSTNKSPKVWGHKGSFQGRPIGYPVVNGVKLNNYTLFGEIMSNKEEYQSELGLLAHEFGHDLALRDLYNSEKKIIEHEGQFVSVSDGEGLGKYSLMAIGSWNSLEGENGGATPAHLDAYSKTLLGLIEPTVVNKEDTVNVNTFEQENFNMFRINTSDPQEYFLIENRQLTGFDASLKKVTYSLEHKYKPLVASGGISIYHVNERYYKSLAPGKQLVTLKEADEEILGYSKLSEARFYNTNNYDGFYYQGMGGHGQPQQTALTKETTPSSVISDGTYPNFDVQVNSVSGSTMSVSFKDNTKESVIAVTGVSVNPKIQGLEVGKKTTLKATISPANATNQKVSWSSSNEEVATVSTTGEVTAKASGKVTITVTTADGNKTATSEIVVKEPVIAVTGVSVDPESQELKVGGKTTLKATVSPVNATNQKVVWNSLNEEVATVSATGEVTAKASGKATIIVTTIDGTKTATCEITVNAPIVLVTGVSINPPSQELEVGKKTTLKATVSPANATNQKVSWSSSNEQVATISTTGEITAKASGKVTITVTTADGNKTATSEITIKEPTIPVTGVSITPQNLRIRSNSIYQLKAAVTPANATNKQIKWTTNNPLVARVLSSGLLIANDPGVATITVTTEDGEKIATSQITVVPERVAVTGISLPTSISLEINQQTTLTPEIQPSHATNKKVTWKSSDSGTVQVSSSGIIKGIRSGTATITATTEDGQKTAATKVTVKAKHVPVTGITLDRTQVIMDVNTMEALNEKIEPATATNKKVHWKSSAPEIVSVDSDGVLTALKSGKAVITVTTDDGKKVATSTITVKSAAKYALAVKGYAKFAELTIDIARNKAELVTLGGRLFPIHVSNINNNMMGASIKIEGANGATKINTYYQLKTLYNRNVETVRLSIGDRIIVKNGSFSTAGLVDLTTGQSVTSNVENSFTFKVTASGLQRQ